MVQEVVVSYNCFTFLLCFRSILTFFDAKIEAVPDFAILRFARYSARRLFIDIIGGIVCKLRPVG